MAECHPVGFQWVTAAKLRGARVIHVDPRFTRTTAQADRHIPIRVGSDIALLGALINHVLSNELWFKDYVLHYTNATTVVSDDFVDTEELDGLFSGWNDETRSYDMSSWAYAERDDLPEEAVDGDSGDDEVDAPDPVDESGHLMSETSRADTQGSGGAPLEHARIKKDPTLQNPRCVLNILRRHYARYTPEMVERVCGISQEDFAYLADSIVQNSGRDRTTAFCYAVGWTQHSDGAQMIRTSTILQLLMGNIGRPGSGVMALRGHASIQGSTDIPTLYNLLPGYLPMPLAGSSDTLAQYLDNIASTKQKGYWANADTYAVSLLKAWWGEKATAENDWGFAYIPRLTGAHGTYQTVMAMLEDKVAGYFVLGQNPAVGSAHSRMQRRGLAHLKWLVVRDLQMIETASFWKDSPEIETGELRTEDIATEVFFLPAANHAEKSGTFTQTQRLLQWRHKAVSPPGDCMSELQFFYLLGQKIRERLAGSPLERDQGLLDLTWDYPLDEEGEVDPEAVLKEINGYQLTGPKAGRLLSSYTEMKADGSTSGGCWIYTGVYADGINMSARRTPHGGDQPLEHEWGWAWPADRRILYNRASADPDGKPWSERKKLVWWDEDAKRWTGDDVPDFPVGTRPDYVAPDTAGGPEALSGTDPFIMQADGLGWLYAPRGMVDGPMPTHYEPAESPVVNPVYGVQASPTRKTFQRQDNLFAASGDEPGAEVFPFVFTTYRLTEHHTAGGMSRWLPYLSELQPEMFCEVSPELAKLRGLENGGWATLVSPRAVIEARVLVTPRMRPLVADGRTVHQIGLPYHWAVGGRAIVTGDSANDLLGVVLDPNVNIQEAKAAACDIRPGRRPQGAARLEMLTEYQSRAGLTVETSQEALERVEPAGGPQPAEQVAAEA